MSNKGEECHTLPIKFYYFKQGTELGLDLFHQVQMPDIFFLDFTPLAV